MKQLPFRMTPRRAEILWHVAYTFEILWSRQWVASIHSFVPSLRLRGTEIKPILIVLKRAGLVRLSMSGRNILHITPQGMSALLETVKS